MPLSHGLDRAATRRGAPRVVERGAGRRRRARADPGRHLSAVARRAEPPELRALLGGAAEDRVGPGAPRSRGAAGRACMWWRARSGTTCRCGWTDASGACWASARSSPPSPFRGRGAAKELLTRMMETAEAEGFEFAALFSEIAPRIYEQLDFVPGAAHRVPARRRSARAAGRRRCWCGAATIGTCRRSPRFQRRARAGARLARGAQRGLHQARHRQEAAARGPGAAGPARSGVPRQRGRPPAGRLHRVRVTQGTWFIEDAGDRDPSGARLGAMLQVMLARHPGEAAARDPRLAAALAAAAAGAPSPPKPRRARC